MLLIASLTDTLFELSGSERAKGGGGGGLAGGELGHGKGSINGGGRVGASILFEYFAGHKAAADLKLRIG